MYQPFFDLRAFALGVFSAWNASLSYWCFIHTFSSFLLGRPASIWECDFQFSRWNSHMYILMVVYLTSQLSWHFRAVGLKVWSMIHCCSVTRLCPAPCDPMDYSTPGFPVFHYLLEFAQINVHWVGDAIQSSHPLLPTSPPALDLSQQQGLFQWVGSSNQVARILALQLQYQYFQRVFRVDFL